MIVQLEEAKHELVGMRPDIEDLGQALRVEFLAAKAEELAEAKAKGTFLPAVPVDVDYDAAMKGRR